MDDYTILARLLLSAALSGLVGLERALRKKPAGLRTHLMVGLGSTLIMLISIHMAEISKGATVDPTRIAANVVAGLGFLGAGTIIHAGRSIHGLTTAASLWAVGALGLAVGCGFYSAALQTTVIMLVALHLLNGIEQYIVRRAGPKTEAALKRIISRGE